MELLGVERFVYGEQWTALAVAAGAVFLLLTLGLLVWRWRSWEGQLRRTLKGCSRRWAQDVVIPDGLGGSVQLDYLLLTSTGLVILDVRRYPGAIFGSETIDQWTQILHGRSRQFENPLRGLELRARAVRELAGEVPVRGRLVFSRESEFPKGMPDGVSRLSTLADDLSSGQKVPDAELESAWEKVMAMVW